jgi:hypothetical protein
MAVLQPGRRDVLEGPPPMSRPYEPSLIGIESATAR